MTEVDVIIEISKGGHIKYEYDKEKNIIVCDRILHTPMKYPFNYGFIPNTISEDGDPLDVVVLMEDDLIPGCMIKCKILGYLDTKDDSGNDPKLIVCPIDKIDPRWKNVNDLFTETEDSNLQAGSFCVVYETINGKNLRYNIEAHTMNRIKYFFQHYKDLEKKSVFVGDFHNKADSLKIYEECINRFEVKLKVTQKNKITNYIVRTPRSYK
jgi:inorganic pyrophosphatase